MVARTNTLKTCTALICVALISACNITDPNPPLENNVTPDTGVTEDTGVVEDVGEDVGEDAGEVEECGGDPKNVCGGCAVLEGSLGDTCGGCGELVCDGMEGLRCSCDTGDGCAFDATGQDACACVDGFLPDATGACVDVDECADAADDCDPLAGCVNEEGGFSCGECPAGTFDAAGDGRSCAPAFEEIEVVAVGGTHPGNTSECLEVSCPAGKVALSGGSERGGALTIDASRRGGADGSRWLICGFAPESVGWEVRAVCAKSNAELVALESEELIATGTSACVDAACPDGYSAVGGGGAWGDLALDHNHALPDGSAWRLCGTAVNADVTVKTSVVCAKTTTNVRRFDADSNMRGEGCLIGTCEEGELFVGGGASWNSQAAMTENAPLSTGVEWRVCRQTTSESDWWVQSVCIPTGD